MKRIVSISEIVDSHEMMKGTRDVIASGEAAYDDARSELVINLDSRVMMTDARGHETKVPAEWLPRPNTMREHVSSEEAQTLARELFHRWVAMVRARIPSPTVQANG